MLIRATTLLLIWTVTTTAGIAAAQAPAAGAPGAPDSTAAAVPAAHGADPLAAIVDEALRANLGLGQERMAERRVAAEVREARALLLPSINVEGRTSHFDNATDFGALVNPAYAALNQLTGTDQFPTNVDFTLPYNYESHARLVQPLFNEPLRASYNAAQARHDGQRSQLQAAARQVAADAQTAYLQQASARRAVEILEATLDLVRENERIAERLLAAGSATPEGVQRARAERAEVEQQLAETRERARAASRAFNLVLKRPLDQPVEAIPDSAFELPLPLGADAAVQRGLAAREELRQVEAGIRAAEAGKRAA
ncbi:MAG TPA: TolC family protein, partial [Candidatus Eisenbacteria bacterium]|nr:TolC family protein [Candidatus Eisenbacteria bacterium]